jgi:hypothetical protein
MTIPRLAAIATVCVLLVDMKFGNGRLVDALWDETTRLGYWLNNEIGNLSYKIAHFR